MFVYLFVHSNTILLENFASNNVFYEDITIVDIEESIESVKLVSQYLIKTWIYIKFEANFAFQVVKVNNLISIKQYFRQNGYGTHTLYFSF